MNVVLVYFSQTGNTRTVAEAMADAFSVKGHTVRTLPMKDALPADIAGCDVLGVGTPCFESQAPAPVKDYLSSLPYMNGKTVFCLCHLWRAARARTV